MWEDDDDDFDFDPNDPELAREMGEERQRVENLPIVKKSKEIFSLVRALSETLDVTKLKPENDGDSDISPEFFNEYKGMMLEDISIISAKIREAEAGDLYTLRMENATVIKMHARSLLTHTSALKMMGYPNHDYLELLYDEIENFRLTFVKWISSFDKMNDIPDGWGMFYDPNMEYPDD